VRIRILIVKKNLADGGSMPDRSGAWHWRPGGRWELVERRPSHHARSGGTTISERLRQAKRQSSTIAVRASMPLGRVRAWLVRVGFPALCGTPGRRAWPGRRTLREVCLAGCPSTWRRSRRMRCASVRTHLICIYTLSVKSRFVYVKTRATMRSLDAKCPE
jgi:hypothetical protein